MFSHCLRSLSILLALIGSTSLYSASCGKVEVGPTFLHIDILESNNTIKKVNMPAIKADANYLVWKGLCLKPGVLYGKQGSTEIFTGGCGLGHYTPITDKCSLTPSVGCTYTQFKSMIKLPVAPGVKVTLDEHFTSVSPYLALEATYCFTPSLRASVLYQYAFGFTRTTIKNMGTTHSKPKGSNMGLLLEYDLNAKWSVNFGAAYNESLTKEKHGLRAYGARLALAYWF